MNNLRKLFGVISTIAVTVCAKAAVTGYSTSGYVKTALGNQTVTCSGRTAEFTVRSFI